MIWGLGSACAKQYIHHPLEPLGWAAENHKKGMRKSFADRDAIMQSTGDLFHVASLVKTSISWLSQPDPLHLRSLVKMTILKDDDFEGYSLEGCVYVDLMYYIG